MMIPSNIPGPLAKGLVGADMKNLTGGCKTLFHEKGISQGEDKEDRDDHDPGNFEEVLIFGSFPLKQVLELVALALRLTHAFVSFIFTVLCVFLGVCLR